MNLLEQLLAPMSLAEFMEVYWNRESVLIRGNPEKAQLPYRTGDFRGVIADALRAVPEHIKLKEDVIDAHLLVMRSGDNVHQDRTKSVGRVEKLLNAGLTLKAAADAFEHGLDEGVLVLLQTHNVVPAFMDFCTAIRGELGQAGDMSSYVFYHSEAGNGRGLHFDSDSTFFIQLSGKRRFRVMRYPVTPFPNNAGSLTSANDLSTYSIITPPFGELVVDLLPDKVEWIDVTLDPGDVVFFPGGAVHETGSVDGSSVGVAISITWRRERELMQQLLRRLVPETEMPWRGGVPSINGDLSEAVSLAKRVFGGEFLQKDAEMQGMIREMLIDEITTPTDTMLLPLPTCQVSAHSRLAHHPTLFFIGEDTETGFKIRAHDNEFDFDEPEQVRFAKALVAQRSFSVSEALQWCGEGVQPEGLIEQLQTLVDLGVLVDAACVSAA